MLDKLERFNRWLDNEYNEYIAPLVTVTALIFAILAVTQGDYTKATFWLAIAILNRPEPAPVIIYATHHDQDA